MAGKLEDETKPMLDDVPFVTATIGRIYLDQGHLDRAEAVFRQLLARRPDDPALLADLQRVADRRAQASEERTRPSSVSQAGPPPTQGPHAPEPKAPEPKAPEPKAPEPKAPEPKAPEPKAPEPKATRREATGPGVPAPPAPRPPLASAPPGIASLLRQRD